ncbi:hypothetical protein VLK31_32420 [Variovorax sp. H27-G14]|uniref:hypothetical protein n=1 Tax=Variovorax sp. H27-G14 TaxID=3111914 RepID=UPI0038FBE568
MSLAVPVIRPRHHRQSNSSTVLSALAEVLATSGYTGIRVLQGKVCAVKQFNFTAAVVVGLDPVGYDRRYCYEHRFDAQAALAG